MSNDLGYPDIGLTTLKDVSYRSNQISRVTNRSCNSTTKAKSQQT